MFLTFLSKPICIESFLDKNWIKPNDYLEYNQIYATHSDIITINLDHFTSGEKLFNIKDTVPWIQTKTIDINLASQEVTFYRVHIGVASCVSKDQTMLYDGQLAWPLVLLSFI